MRRVEALRLEKKRSTSKKDKNKSDVFHQWQGDWKNARAELVTADIMWFERARTHGLHVEMETGRWHKIPREKKDSAQAVKPLQERPSTQSSSAHSLTTSGLRESGLQDVNIWSVIKKAGGSNEGLAS